MAVAFASLCAAASGAFTLQDAQRSVDLWPHLTMLADTDRALDADAALARRNDFVPPASATSALGFRREAIWLLATVDVDSRSDGRWILDIDYALVNRADIHVADGISARHLATLGNLQPLATRPLGARTPALALDLPAGRRVDILIRIDSVNSLMLPIHLSKPAAYQQRAGDEFLLQGILIAIGLCLLMFSLQQWASLRDPVFGKYALLIVCNLVFAAHLFGIGSLYLWRDWPWMETHAAGISSLLTSCAMALFVEGVLGADLKPVLRAALKAIAVMMVACALLFALDAMNARWLGLVMGVFGMLPAVLGLQGALARVRRGDSIGAYFIVAWIGYFVSGWMLYGAVTGLHAANFWTLHALQFGATFDMLVFMRIVMLRSLAAHHEAQRASAERDALNSLANSDPLTGLMNRRGLNAALGAALANCDASRRVAVLMLDLDGFKPVNDQHGHDAGDELLASIAGRLRAAVRATDTIARVGGDEFVVVAPGLPDIARAEELAAKLLALFAEPIVLPSRDGAVCAVGVTIGVAVAPDDGVNAPDLLRAADQAMYRGKENGKGRVMRFAVS